MAKNSFIVYDNWRFFFSSLSDEDAGKLIKAIFSYRTGEEVECEVPAIKATFEFIKSTLISDQAKYEEKCEKARTNIQSRWKR